MEFGKKVKVDIREIWKKEDSDFTPWLADNIRELGEVLGMDLEVIETEAKIGNFILDVLAKDLGSQSTVVIENQFYSTDHDHLGKLITYAAGFEADVAVWVAEEIKDEHKKALEWLNQKTDARTLFFGVVIEVMKIDDSRPAYEFKPIVVPSEWPPPTIKESIRGEAYRKYFQELIDELRINHKFTSAKRAQPQNWYSFASGFGGVTYGATFAQGGRVRTELYIDLGNKEENLSLFEWLLDKKEEIDSKLGMEIEWDRLEGRRACRVAVSREGNINADEKELKEMRDWHISTLLKFKEVFAPLIEEWWNER